MPRGLKRYQETGDLHFVTFSCHDRRPYLNSATSRDLFVEILLRISIAYEFRIDGYVVMPEHVHLLLDEPAHTHLARAIQALKCSIAKRQPQRPFWYPRYYDFNVFTEAKRIEKLNYMHWNPVKRGLCTTPESWPWSSATPRHARIPTASPAALEMGHLAPET
jgi:putative transposase